MTGSGTWQGNAASLHTKSSVAAGNRVQGGKWSISDIRSQVRSYASGPAGEPLVVQQTATHSGPAPGVAAVSELPSLGSVGL